VNRGLRNGETGYGDHMTSRARVVLLAIAVLALVPGAVVGMAMVDDRSPVSTSLVDSPEPAVGHVAVPVRASVPLVPRGLPESAIVVTVAAAAVFSLRRRSLRGLPFRLGDVGDGWRALLFGAPPAFL
jgi:hypothetical protein